MKLFVTIMAAVLGLAAARPQLARTTTTTRILSNSQPIQPVASVITRQQRAEPIAITSYVNHSPDREGAFDYAFETENGIKQEAQGRMKKVDDETEVLVMRGSYEFIGPDGLTYVVDWEADENGFRPSAPHLPVPVEIPHPEVRAAVAAQLEQAALQPAAFDAPIAPVAIALNPEFTRRRY